MIRKYPASTTTTDFAKQQWNTKVDSLWPWKKAILDGYKEKVEFSSFYSTSGPDLSPYGTSGASKLIIQMHLIFNKISEMANESKITIEE
uniref:Uncharacterized protein n=1 Tax=Panagrolaimus superbus TaxID=310955 RepID=A0A914YCL5_9BILA